MMPGGLKQAENDRANQEKVLGDDYCGEGHEIETDSRTDRVSLNPSRKIEVDSQLSGW